MERSFFGALAAFTSSLLSISTLGAIAFIWSSPGPSPVSGPKPEGDWRLLDPVAYENISIFPVVSSSGHDTSAFLTLDDGLASGEVIVSERGSEGMIRNREGRRSEPIVDYTPSGPSVNQLVLINRSKRPLLLLAGELVSGGKQDRIIGKDRIVPVGAPPLPLDVFCVEHGRWSSGAQFNAAKTMVHPSVREKAAVDQEQTKVWSAVRNGTTYEARAAAPPAAAPRISTGDLSAAMSERAPTQSYAKIYQESRVGASVDTFVAEVQRRFAKATSGLKGERVVGVVVAYGGEVAWSDIFASADLFDHYWTKLLRSYAVEALARPTFREAASRDNASEFLRRLSGRETQETDPGVYRWREITDGRFAQIELDSIEPKTIALHRIFVHRTS